MKKNYLFLLPIIFGLLAFSGFSQGNYDNGVFVLNEGMYGTNTASVSFLSASGTINNNVFATENTGMDIGQLAQGMGFSGDNAYIVSNGTSEINIVDRATFTHITTVTTGLDNPRNIEFDNGYAYITNWGDPTNISDDFVAVLDLDTNTITSTISVNEGPEQIVKKNNQLFVAHQGGYGFGNTVSVIDLNDNSVSEISVADVPNSIVADDDFLYVLCGGKPAWTGAESLGKLYRIDLVDFSVMDVYNFALGEHPNFLQVDNGQAYYVVDNNIYNFDFSASLPTTEFINTASEGVAIAYGLSLIDNVLYLSDAENYVIDGKVVSYNTTGVFQNSYTVGVIPNGVYKHIMPLGVYPPAAGQIGSTAIETNSALFVDWASGATVTRGLTNIADSGSGYATIGTESNVTGVANNAIISLGDGGNAILTFDTPITDGSGYDFAVFENSFSDTFLELAFVEVSSDGVNYFRFPSHSQTQTDTQVGGFGAVDATYINNLAGKYRAGFGTPFDLNDIPNNPLLDKTRITHVKVVDAIGTIDPAFATYDSYGNMVNDPYPTPFGSGGFDLDAVGVINQVSLSIADTKLTELKIYPNPASSFFNIKGVNGVMDMDMYDITGKLVKQLKNTSLKTIDISSLKQGVYVVKITSQNKNGLYKLIKQ
ncbi:DUF5074 domain-containing protein [Bizionia hallyeonensis]|uniref:DUF5074 domain-containing protein n=1 Tax=Bizionia hallyeonensis TaxID=1123757 RepID=A0ABW0C7I8_9FLAO